MKSRSLLLFVFCVSCEKSVNDEMYADKISPPTGRLIVKNACSYDIWLEQDNLLNYDKVISIKSGDQVIFDIPAEGLSSTRFWPKKDCDANGDLCTVGQSSPPCLDSGCLPPVDSKLEVTWGCTLDDKESCGRTPQGEIMYDTWWDTSLVDGYTFPFSLNVIGGDGRDSCIPANCSGLSLTECPLIEDMSNHGVNPIFGYEDLNLDGGVGCFSPCMKFGYPTYGGLDMNDPSGSAQASYCCPTPPISPEECESGPLVSTHYVDLVHAACGNSVYAFPYDDTIGLRNCSSDTVLEFIIGPDCP